MHCVSVSGLKKGLSETLFAARPDDLPAALAQAEELESNKERYQFAASFNRPFKTRDVSLPKTGAPRNDLRIKASNNYAPRQKFYNRKISPNYVPIRPTEPDSRHFPPPEPMDIDPLLRASFSKKTGNGGYKRRQGINNLMTTVMEDNLREIVEEEDELEVVDNINFFGVSPISSSSKS